ncbi:MAG: glycosyltransferase family 2 protein [Taibaiella sp.]|nr:glycosyltransferase family 2 protein [Taibaiella sp.]
MICISVVIITLNEQKNIDRCLASVKNIADEIVIVDSYSKDDTLKIAASYGARIIMQDFLGYGAQKNFANQQASHNWILSLDADEALSTELRDSIIKVKVHPEYDTYSLTRLTNYCGKWIRHCGWYPDKKVRLFDKTKGVWKGEKIHEYWEPKNDDSKIGELAGDLLHYSYYTVSDHIIQLEKFTDIAAREAVAQGKDCSIWKIVVGPFWNFFSNYIIRLGILDGAAGYLICKITAYATFVKYAKIRQYARMGRKAITEAMPGTDQ